MHYVGMDTHINTLDFAVVNEAGRLVKAHSIATSVNGFIGFVKTVPAPRIIYMEEGTLAAWALETCVRFGEKLVIADPKKNHWIGSSSQKDDPLDALKLAQLGRGGYIKEIHHPVGQRRRFRELMIAYHDTVRSTPRVKNKIKAKFRQNGIQCTGVTVYSEDFNLLIRRSMIVLRLLNDHYVSRFSFIYPAASGRLTLIDNTFGKSQPGLPLVHNSLKDAVTFHLFVTYLYIPACDSEEIDYSQSGSTLIDLTYSFVI